MVVDALTNIYLESTVHNPGRCWSELVGWLVNERHSADLLVTRHGNYKTDRSYSRTKEEVWVSRFMILSVAFVILELILW